MCTVYNLRPICRRKLFTRSHRYRNQAVYLARVISASCTYEFPISVTGTYTLFLLRFYIIRILRVVARANSPRSAERQEQPLVPSDVCRIPPAAAARLIRFCSRYRPVISTKVDSRSRQGQRARASAYVAFLIYSPAPVCSRGLLPSFLPGAFVFATRPSPPPPPHSRHSSFARSQVEREQIRYPLTSVSELEVLIAVTPRALLHEYD